MPLTARDDKITRPTISAKFLLADKPAKRDAVIVPAHVTITRYAAKPARGAYRVKSSAMGAQPTSGFVGYDKYLRAYAAKGA